MLIIMDVPGTLFSFEKIKRRFRESGLRPDLTDLWYARLVQSSMAATLAGKYTEFKILARSVLQQLLGDASPGKDKIDHLIQGLQELDPFDDAADCLHALRADGHRLIALSNDDRDAAKLLLERSGLWKWFERVYSADMAKACKPCRQLYELLFRILFAGPYECCMVSAQGSDILGAEGVGMNSVYIDRNEGQWPFPEGPSGLVVSCLRDVPGAVARNFGRPAEEQESTAGKGSKWYGEA